MPKLSKEELLRNLPQFTGTEGYTKYLGGLLLTDGVAYLAQNAGCFWLLDIIWSVQHKANIRNEEFQSWKCTAKDGKAVVECTDGNKKVLYTQKVDFTDIPLDEVKMFVQNKVIMLTSEY